MHIVYKRLLNKPRTPSCSYDSYTQGCSDTRHSWPTQRNYNAYLHIHPDFDKVYKTSDNGLSCSPDCSRILPVWPTQHRLPRHRHSRLRQGLGFFPVQVLQHTDHLQRSGLPSTGTNSPSRMASRQSSYLWGCRSRQDTRRFG